MGREPRELFFVQFFFCLFGYLFSLALILMGRFFLNSYVCLPPLCVCRHRNREEKKWTQYSITQPPIYSILPLKRVGSFFFLLPIPKRWWFSFWFLSRFYFSLRLRFELSKKKSSSQAKKNKVVKCLIWTRAKNTVQFGSIMAFVWYFFSFEVTIQNDSTILEWKS